MGGPDPAALMRRMFVPAGGTSMIATSPDQVWLKLLSVTLTSVVLPGTPDTGIGEG